MRPALIWIALTWIMLTALIGPAVTIPSGQRVVGNLGTYTENIRVDGEVTGNVTSWSGNIIINGAVGGDVVSYTGAVHLMSNARIAGSTMTLSGKLQSSPSAQVQGQQFSSVGVGRVVRPVVGIFTSASPAATGLSTMALAATSTVFGALVLATVFGIASIWPGRSRAAAYTLRKMPGRSLVLGMLMLIAIATLAPLAIAALASTVIGLPVAILALVLANIICVYGLTVLIQAARASLEGTATSSQLFSPGMIGLAIALVMPIVLIALIAPLSALLLFYLMACPGLGATALQGVGGTKR